MIKHLAKLENKIIELKEFAPDSEDTTSRYSFKGLGLIRETLPSNILSRKVKTDVSRDDLRQPLVS